MGFTAPTRRTATGTAVRYASVRLQVTPKQAEVYLDGYYVGVVDDFDGVFQRLDTPTGQHELQVYMQGYKSLDQKMLFRPGQTYKVSAVLQPLAPGDPPEPRPVAAPRPERQYEGPPPGYQGPQGGYPPPPEGYPPPAEGYPPPPSGRTQPPAHQGEMRSGARHDLRDDCDSCATGGRSGCDRR